MTISKITLAIVALAIIFTSCFAGLAIGMIATEAINDMGYFADGAECELAFTIHTTHVDPADDYYTDYYNNCDFVVR